MHRSAPPVLAVLLAAVSPTGPTAQQDAPGTTEEPLARPDPLVRTDGRTVEGVEGWAARRAEILRLFRDEVYGHEPDASSCRVLVEDLESTDGALGGRARRLQLRVVVEREVEGDLARLPVDLLVYLPDAAEGRAVPCFLGLNFKGNHTVHADPAIRLPRSWVRDEKAYGTDGNRAGAGGRGRRAHRWPVERILERGYGFATAYYGDLDPDFDDGFANGLHRLWADEERDDRSWGTIAAWAFGLSRLLDAMATLDGVDAGRVALLGHSRLGKTALWAGALDPRFAMVWSNDSGCGGAALSKRRSGETVEAITRRFPHWFCGRFARYADREDALPLDQHLLVALTAPRPVYVASASADAWADPLGEFLATKAAEPVYALFGHRGSGLDAWPPPGGHSAPDHGRVGYHLREGAHDLTAWDWQRVLDFADHQLR